MLDVCLMSFCLDCAFGVHLGGRSSKLSASLLQDCSFSSLFCFFSLNLDLRLRCPRFLLRQSRGVRLRAGRAATAP